MDAGWNMTGEHVRYSPPLNQLEGACRTAGWSNFLNPVHRRSFATNIRAVGRLRADKKKCR